MTSPSETASSTSTAPSSMELELERRLEGMHIRVNVAEMSDGQRFAVIGQS